MRTTKEMLREWFERGKDQGASYMIVVCDTFDHEDYPVFATAENYTEKYESHDGQNMQRIMEVYDLRQNMQTQLAERCAWNGPK